MHVFLCKKGIDAVMGALLHLPSSTIMYYTVPSQKEETLKISVWLAVDMIGD